MEKTAETGEWKGYETPGYSVEARFGEVEIRRTEPHLAAEIALRGERAATLRQGFRALAGFIFGKNDGGAKVAMTAPVTQAPRETARETMPLLPEGAGNTWTVRFAMPSRHSRETLPTSSDDRIRIVEVSGERVAALRFSGWGSLGRWQFKESELRSLLSSQGLRPAGPARHLYYDDPFTPPWRRRNEVVIPLREAGAA